MSDHGELKKAALRVVEIESSEGESISDAWEDFESAANPVAVLALITEVEALRRDAERYRWLVMHAEEIYVEPPGSRGVNIYVDSFQAKRDSSIKESMDIEIDGLMAKASTP